MSLDDFDTLLKKYLSGNCTAREEKIVLEWYEKLIEESALELSSEQKQIIEQKIWSAVAANIGGGSVKAPKSKVVSMQPRKFYRLAIAACFILLAGIGVYWFVAGNQQMQTFARFDVPEGYLHLSNEEKSVQIVRLSDGSEVTLQPNSSLYYPKTFREGSRDVYLTGNALFNVYHQTEQHFIVHTEAGLLTEDLGTSFTIEQNRQLNKIEVSVLTGKVRVYEERNKSEREKAVVLRPNQKVSFNATSRQFVTAIVDDPKPLAGEVAVQHNTFVFEETPLYQIINKLQQTYGISIVTENKKLENCHFTGDLSRKKLFEKLDIISQSIQCSYEVKDTAIILKGKGCN
jgi:ferric-dicitrate binding protein FerR (iron transport regulator)